MIAAHVATNCGADSHTCAHTHSHAHATRLSVSYLLVKRNDKEGYIGTGNEE